MQNRNDHLKNKIHDYLEGRLAPNQIDELWAEMLADDEEFEYLETLALLKKMGAEGQFSETPAEYIEPGRGKFQNKPVFYYVKYAAVAAAVILLSITVVYQPEFSGNPAKLAPITSIEYEVERSGDVMASFDALKNDMIELSNTQKIDAAAAVFTNALAGGELTSHQENDLRVLMGAIYYNANQFERAKLIFQEGIDKIDNREEFINYEKNLWYLANTHLQLNETTEAIQYIESVISLDGAFSRVAKQVLSGR